MSCPDWNRLAAHRRDREADEPSQWESAVAHLRSCDRCQNEAVRVDPTLLFARMPETEVAESEIASMQDRVRAGRLSPSQRRMRPLVTPAGWLRLAATVGLMIAVFGLQSGQAPSDQGKGSEAREGSTIPGPRVASGSEVVHGSPHPGSLPQASMAFSIELLDQDSQSRLQVADGDLTVVMIFNEAFHF